MENHLILLHLRSHRITQSFIACQVSLGGAEGEEHIQTHGQVVFVVRNIEADELMVLAVLTLNKGEYKATILGVAVFHFDIGDAIVLQP